MSAHRFPVWVANIFRLTDVWKCLFGHIAALWRYDLRFMNQQQPTRSDLLTAGALNLFARGVSIIGWPNDATQAESIGSRSIFGGSVNENENAFILCCAHLITRARIQEFLLE